MKTKTKAIIVLSSLALGSAFIAYASMSQPIAYQSSLQATSTAPTRAEKTQALINELAEARKRDSSFIQETQRMQKELEQSRERQARIDALLIVQTKIEEEAHKLQVEQDKK